MKDPKVVSLREATIQKNEALISEASQRIIESSVDLLRFSGVSSGTLMAVDPDTGLTTHIITIKCIEDKQ